MQTATYWLSLIMIFLIPWEGIAALPGFGSASRLVGFVVAASWLLLIVVRGGFRKFSPFHVLVFLFFLWSAISIFWSLYPDYTTKRIITYIRMAGLMLIIWELYNTQDALRAGLQALVLGGFAPVAYIIYNFIVGKSHTFYRYAAVGRDTNTYGFIIAFTIPVAIYLIASTPTGKNSQLLTLANLVYIPAAAFAVALTGTRFAMIMTIPALLFMMIALNRFHIIWRILIFVIISGAILYIATIIPEGTLLRLGTADDEIVSGDLNGRVAIWRHGLNMWFRQPILGIGSGAFPRAAAPIYGVLKSMHNSFFSVLVETGLIGFFLFVSILATAIYKIRNLPKFETLFWVTILAVWGLGNMVMTWEHTNSTWLLFSLIIVAAKVSPPQGELTSPTEYSRNHTTAMSHAKSLAIQSRKAEFRSNNSR